MSRSGKLENIVFLLLSSPQDSEIWLNGFNYEGNKGHSTKTEHDSKFRRLVLLCQQLHLFNKCYH